MYNEISPSIEERSDYQTAMICYTLYAMLGSKKGKKAKFSDFLLKFGEQEAPPKQSKKEMMWRLKSWLQGAKKQMEKKQAKAAKQKEKVSNRK